MAFIHTHTSYFMIKTLHKLCNIYKFIFILLKIYYTRVHDDRIYLTCYINNYYRIMIVLSNKRRKSYSHFQFILLCFYAIFSLFFYNNNKKCIYIYYRYIYIIGSFLWAHYYKSIRKWSYHNKNKHEAYITHNRCKT